MKIAVLTFCNSKYNYGQLLQAFALQEYLTTLGHECRVIRTDYDTRRLVRVLNTIGLLPLFRFFYRKLKGYSKTDRHFEEFRKKYIRGSSKVFYSYKQLCSHLPQADVYIAGSDQVWAFSRNVFKRAKNKEVFFDYIKTYFMDFNNAPIKRLSYAASFGCKLEDIDKDVQGLIAPLIKRFSYVSVREESGIKIAQALGVTNPTVDADPTLLLPASYYRTFYKKEVNASSLSLSLSLNAPYLLVYRSKNPSIINMEAIYEYARMKGLEVVYIISGEITDEYKKTYATIPEWLYLVDNAKAVISNSFHASLFCLLFNKCFATVPLNKDYQSMNTRFSSLFSLFNTEPRLLETCTVEAIEALLGKEYTAFLNSKVEFSVEKVLAEGEKE